MPTPYTPPGSSTSYDVPADLDAVDVGVWFEDFADTVDAALALKLANAPAKNTQTADFDFALTDAAGLLVVANKATALAGTLKQNSAMASSWPADSVVRFINRNDGVLTITAGSGVTIIGTPLTFAKGKGGALVWVAANTWVCVPFSSGDAAAVVSGTTGSPTTATGVSVGGRTMDTWRWTANGSVTIATAGKAFVVVTGAGSNTGAYYGAGAVVFAGWVDLTAATHTIGIGATGSPGGGSYLGTLVNAPGGVSQAVVSESLGAGRAFSGANIYDGVSSDITGASVSYGQGARAGSPTPGTYGSGNGGAGVVYIGIVT